MTTTIHCQFKDTNETEIISIFGGEQDPAVWANLGTVPSTDERYVAYYNAVGEWMQQHLIAPGD